MAGTRLIAKDEVSVISHFLKACESCHEHTIVHWLPLLAAIRARSKQILHALVSLPARVKGKDQRFSKARITMKFTTPFCFTSFCLSLLTLSHPPTLSSNSFRNVISKAENKPPSSKRIQYVVWMPSSL